ncbi:MAG: imidazole glycerol phosphate synthase subunit HisH [Gammaproteobacteria bacterium]|nr:imidazole glycerol phosphate synthase subunit HisH [Gammaproteobacteria bacterium]
MNPADIALIDGGGANIASLQFALARLGRTGVLTTDHDIIRAAQHVILPGVGAARDAMERLERAGLVDIIPTLSQPVLGICLGLQLLFDASEEDQARCLGILPGTATLFDATPELTVPHMGWNRVYQARASGLLEGVADGAHFYFVHSYALPVGEFTIGRCDYGREFSAVVERDNFVATQFHPERSGTNGARLLANFLAR